MCPEGECQYRQTPRLHRETGGAVTPAFALGFKHEGRLSLTKPQCTGCPVSSRTKMRCCTGLCCTPPSASPSIVQQQGPPMMLGALQENLHLPGTGAGSHHQMRTSGVLHADHSDDCDI